MTAHHAGERIADLELVTLLGQGGFSEVWRARPIAGGRDVAVKFLLSPEHVETLRREAVVHAIVRGRGVVKVLAARVDDEPPHLVLELIERGDLRAHVTTLGGRLAVAPAVLLVARLMDTLGRLHREGVVHGDVKPENVLLGDAGPLLADLGLSRRALAAEARLSASLSVTNARLAGTLDYMAPELRAGELPTPSSDTYSLGVLLHELLTGERPQGSFRLPGERDGAVPPVVDRLLARMLAAEPARRFATAGAARRYLARGIVLDEQRLGKRPEEATPQFPFGHVSLMAQLRSRGFVIAPLAIPGLILAIVVAVGIFDRSLRERVAWVPFLVMTALSICVPFGVRALILPWLTRRAEARRRPAAQLEAQRSALVAWYGLKDHALLRRKRRRAGRVAGLLMAALGALIYLLDKGGHFELGPFTVPNGVIGPFLVMLGLVVVAAPERATEEPRR